MATEIGIIKSLIGTVTATATDGSVRNLQIGDKIYQNDLITTGAAGAVEIEFLDGTTMDMGRSTQAILDLDVFDPSAPVTETAETTDVPDDIAALQQALLAGEDVSVAGEATAAGAGTAGDGSEGGSSFVVRNYLNPEVTPDNGFDTTGPSILLETPEELNLIVEEETTTPVVPPVVSVSVDVEIDIEDPQSPPPEDGIPTPEYPVLVNGNAASVLEGTSDGNKVVVFVINLSAPFAQDVTVTYSLYQNGFADPSIDPDAGVAGEDWIATQYTNIEVIIPAGSTQIFVPVSIVEDRIDEGNGEFLIVLESATNATINPDANSATVTIYDDDTTPVAVDDENTLVDNGDMYEVSGNVLTNDTDEDGDDEPGNGLLEVVIPEGETEIVILHQYGTLTIEATGAYTFELNEEGIAFLTSLGEGAQEEITFTDAYQVTDGVNDGNFADVVITLEGINDVPQGKVGPQNNYDSDVISLDISGNFTDADGDSLTFSATGLPPGLTMGANGVITGTIDADASDKTDDDNNTQVYSVKVTVDDGNGGVEEFYFDWTVDNTIPEFLSGDDVVSDPVIDTPVNDDAYTFNANEGTLANTVVGTVVAVDADGDTNVYSIISGNDEGLFAIDPATGQISVTADIDDDQLGQYVLTVQVDDNEGGTDTATVTINLNNINDAPVIVAPDPNSVSEEGLAGGIADDIGTPDTTNLTVATGTVEASDADGDSLTFTLGTPSESLTSGGYPVVWSGNGTNTLTATANGVTVATLTIDNSGNYTFTLLKPIQHGDTTIEDAESLTFGVTVSDGALSDDTTLTISIEDDSPVLSFVENQVVPNVEGVYAGDWGFAAGADGLAAINITLNNEVNIDLIANSTSVYDAGSGTATYTAFLSGGEVFFTLTMNADGTYQFDYVTPEQEVVIEDTTNVAVSIGGNVYERFLEDIADAKNVTLPSTDISFTAHNGWSVGTTTLGAAATVNSNANGLGVGTGQTMANGESMTMTYLVGDGNANTTSTEQRGITSTTLTFGKGSNAAAMPANYSVYVILYDATDSVVFQGYMNVSNGELEITQTEPFYSMTVVNTGNEGILITSVTTSYVENVQLPSDVMLDFGVEVVDGDGDADSHNFIIGIDADEELVGSADADAILGTNGVDVISGNAGNDIIDGGEGADIIDGGIGNDIIIGGAGDDILTGGAGSDLFVMTQGGGIDTITDFNQGDDPGVYDAAEGDSLDLSDLLAGVTINEETLDMYFQVTNNGGDAVVSVDVTGTGNFQQVAVLEGAGGQAGNIQLNLDTLLVQDTSGTP